jgi:hypothetical protein
MNIGYFLKWNPFVPAILLALVAYRAWARGFPLYGWIAIAVIGLWLAITIANLVCSGRLVQWAYSEEQPEEPEHGKIDLRSLTATQLADLPDFDLSLAAYEIISAPIDGMEIEQAQDRVRKLPPLIRPLYTVLTLKSEVENGGFNQYFWNSAGRLAPEALADLQRLGADQHAALLKEAMVIADKERPVVEKFRKEANWEAFAESYKHTDLGHLDDKFYALPTLDAIRADHIRRNWQEIQGFFRAQQPPAN